MQKNEFLDKLQKRLSSLPRGEVEERLRFYSEMIDDRIEEGLSEENAVAAIGTVDDIASQLKVTEPLDTATEDTQKKKRPLKVWEIVLLVLGAPLWISLLAAAFSVIISLLAAAFSVIISLYATLWSVIVSLWAAFGSLVGCAVGGVLAGAVHALTGNAATGIATVGGGIVCAGLSIFLFFGCREATKATVWLTKKMALTAKKLFRKKEAA